MTIDYKKYWFIYLLITAIIGWGVWIFTKISLREIPPFLFTFLRFLFALVFIFPFFLKEKPKINKDIWKILWLSLFATWNVTLFALGIKHTTAISAQMLYVFTPILTGILAFFFLSEKFNKLKIGGMVLWFIGTIIVTLLPVFYGDNIDIGSIKGNILILIAMLSFTLYTILSKPIQKRYSPIYITTFFILTTLFVVWIFSIIEYTTIQTNIFHISLSSWGSLLYVWVAGTGAYYLLHQFFIKKLSPVIASLLLYIQPAVAIVWAIPILHEKVTPLFLVAGIVALLGVWLSTKK